MIESIPDIAVVVILGFVLFGAKNIPDIGRNLGRGLREFRGGMKDLKNEMDSILEPQTYEVQTVTARATDPITPTVISVEDQAKRLES